MAIKNTKSDKTELSYSVVIVEYFSGQHLISCLESLNKQTFLPDKIVVVINGIDKEIKEIVSNKYTDTLLIEPNENLGYSRAANLGIANTTSPIVLTLNPDTELESDVAQVVCEYMSNNSEVGTIGPRIYESNGEIYPSARQEPSIVDALGHALLGQFFKNNRFTKRYRNSFADPNETRNVDWLSGAAVFIRRQALDEVGGWDEDYFMYCEDIDLGRKMRLNRWKNVYLPSVSLVHVQGVSTSRTPVSLLVRHHISLYTYASKKYQNNWIMKVAVGIFIALRLPLALIAHFFRIN